MVRAMQFKSKARSRKQAFYYGPPGPPGPPPGPPGSFGAVPPIVSVSPVPSSLISSTRGLPSAGFSTSIVSGFVTGKGFDISRTGGLSLESFDRLGGVGVIDTSYLYP